ncbi:MAG: DNA polymerase III subunit delta' [bacterium]|nr:DNA polymerase III subunit delta' [bacterium]
MKLGDVAGNAAAVGRLRAAVRDDRPAAAYLLHGPAGLGKRRIADGFAARLLCATPDGDDACGSCAQCTRVAAGTHPDLKVVERDQERRDIRTEQARELTRWLGLRPLMAERKVAIIDDAECLNEHGQNALLKTLEEPPGAAVLVLVATRATLLLPTVRSRCQRIRFDPLEPAEVTALLVARGVKADAAATMAARAEGSPGRALALIDDADAGLRTTILERLAELDRAAAVDCSALAQAMAKGAVDAALDVVVAWYRDLLAVACEGDAARLRNPDVRAALATAAARTSVPAVLRQLECVCDTVDAVQRNANRALALETLLLDLRRIERDPAGQAA